MDAHLAELRHQYRAARTYHRAARTAVAAEARCARADAILRPALASAPSLALPGYRVTLDATGALIVDAVPVTNPDQLALWRELAQETNP